MSKKFAAFLIPLLAVVIPLYHTLASLGIVVTRAETLAIGGMLLGGATLIGLLAAFGSEKLQILLLGLSTLFLLDLALGMGSLFDGLASETRARDAEDAGRIADLQMIQEALETYMLEKGRLPRPAQYGESNESQSWWNGFWDVSTADADDDGNYFLDFLVDDGVLPSVPLDPDNEPLNNNGGPRGGQRYVYFLASAGYKYKGGTCLLDQNLPVYMLAITDLETQAARPPEHFPGSGCECLWQEASNFFQQHFDYLLCGAAAPIARSGQLTRGGQLPLTKAQDRGYFPGRLVISKRTSGKVQKDGEIELVSVEGAVLHALSARSFLERGSLTLFRRGRTLLEGSVEGGEKLLSQLDWDSEARLGRSNTVVLKADGHLLLPLEFPGRITKASFSLSFRNHRNRYPLRIAFQVIEPGERPAAPAVKEAPRGRSGTLRWTWEPANEKTRRIQLKVAFPADPQVGLSGLSFRLEGENDRPYWAPGTPSLASLKNSTEHSFEVEWAGNSRL